MTPLKTLAFTIYESYGPIIKGNVHYDSSRDIYFVPFETDLSQSERAVEVHFRNYRDSSYTEVLNDKYITAQSQGGAYFTGFMFNCNTYYELNVYKANGTEVGYLKFHATDIKSPICDSTGNEDYSPPVGEDGGSCGCIFKSPEWGEFMDKIDGIREAIPPPPNWQQVAETFDSTIRPRLIADVGNLLGEAPPPPPPPLGLGVVEPIKPPNEIIENYADKLKEKEPVMQDVPGLSESGFTKDDIESAAPEIEFRDDPTGGFNIGNPLDAIPKVYEPPVPGQPASNWMEIPSAPQQTPPSGGEVNVGSPPIPGNNTGTPPVPGGDFTPPTPGNNAPAPPTPGHNTPEPGEYKRHPEHPDGSG